MEDGLMCAHLRRKKNEKALIYSHYESNENYQVCTEQAKETWL